MPLLPLHGHDRLRARLLDALARDALPQGILLHGAPGIGKQRLALWLAQVLVCARKPRPCGQCQSCRYALELTHPDILWVFPRPRLKDSDPSVDEVRSDLAGAASDRIKNDGLYAAPPGNEGIFVAVVRLLVHMASVTPALASRKVFVVGDADRMVMQEGKDEAANAFLKLLEEPPADTFLVLTTSAPGALLPTIRSRVASVRVAPLTDGDVESWMATDAVRKALAKEQLPRGEEERVRLAAGAPGRLIGLQDSSAASEVARRWIEAAASGDLGRILRAGLAQGSSGARGSFRDALDSLTIALHARVRAAVGDRDEAAARQASSAMELIEESKRLAAGNVNPQLITASLLRSLAPLLRGARS